MTVELTVTQQRFFALARADERFRPPNITSVFELSGDLDPTLLQRAFEEVLDRHELFRIGYAADGLSLVEYQRTSNPITSRAIQCESDDAILPEIFGIVNQRQIRSFEPTECPLISALLVSANSRRLFLILTIDHMIADGLSIGMLVRELAFVYLAKKKARRLSLPKAQATYWDHVRCEAELLHNEGPERLSWWKTELSGYVPNYPADTWTMGSIGASKSTIPAHVFGGMVATARKAGLSVSGALLQAYAKAASRIGLGDDLIVNKVISNRSEKMRAVFGDFIDLLPVRFRSASDDNESLKELSSRLQAAEDHTLPYWALTERLYPEFYLHPYGISRVWFNYFPPHSQRLVNTPDLTIELQSALTPPPKLAPCSMCLNVQPMLSGEAEILVWHHLSDVSDSDSKEVLREVESACERSVEGG